MGDSKRAGRTLSKTLFLGVIVLVAAAIFYSALRGSSGDWPVPEQARELKNPLPPTPGALKSAQSVYEEKCANCHGKSGQGDGADAARYDPRPTNFTDGAQMNGATDGELFYKISEGKKPMPVFKTKLTEEQRWELVLLIRAFGQRDAQAGPAP